MGDGNEDSLVRRRGMVVSLKEKRAVVEIGGRELVVRVKTDATGKKTVKSIRAMVIDMELLPFFSEEILQQIIDIS